MNTVEIEFGELCDCCKAKVTEQKFFKEIKGLTFVNNHGEALLTIATYFKLEKYIEIFKEINRKHDKAGYLDYDLNRERYQKSKEMINAIRFKHGEEMSKKVNSCL